MHVGGNCAFLSAELYIIAGRGAFLGREAQVNRGKHRKVRNPQEAIMFRKFVSIKRGKSVLAPVSGSSLFP